MSSGPVAESADAADLKSVALGHPGSSPGRATTLAAFERRCHELIDADFEEHGGYYHRAHLIQELNLAGECTMLGLYLLCNGLGVRLHGE